MYAVINLGIWIAGALGTKFEYRPVGLMFGVEEFDQLVRRVAVSLLWPYRARSRRCNYCADVSRVKRMKRAAHLTVVCDVAKVKAGLRVAGSWTGDDLAKESSLGKIGNEL